MCVCVCAKAFVFLLDPFIVHIVFMELHTELYIEIKKFAFHCRI